jgi:cytochrome c peroxidase
MLCIGFVSCDPDPEIVLDNTPFVLDYGDLPAPDIAADNPLTIQKVKLGRMLFYETMLSKNGEMSCATCHVQVNGFSDTTRFSIGVEGLPGKRQAMAVFNMAWNSNEFFWDGRAHLLRHQSLKPIEDPLEMNEMLDNVITKLSADQMYTDQFMRAFGSEDISSEKMSLAMEAFMNTIVSNDSKYDQYLAGTASLTESEERGMNLFFTEYNPFFPDMSGADCAHCHGGENFENDLYMNNGLDTDAEIQDDGRMKVTMNAQDRGKFKVVSLRNIELTPPYMHDGRFTTLEEVVDHYNDGLKLSTTLDPALEATMAQGLLLSEQDKMDLVNFLKTLTDNTMINKEEYSDPF